MDGLPFWDRPVRTIANARLVGRQDIFQMYIGRYKGNYPEIIAGFPAIEEFARGGALCERVGR